MPDYFLDEAEEFMEKWTSDKKSASSSSPAGLFEKIKPLINAEIVQKIQATYRFAVTGDNPGVCVCEQNVVCTCCIHTVLSYRHNLLHSLRMHIVLLTKHQVRVYNLSIGF